MSDREVNINQTVQYMQWDSVALDLDEDDDSTIGSCFFTIELDLIMVTAATERLS